MKTIIIATNFSVGAKNAGKFAIQLFRDIDVQYVLVNSYYEPPAANDIVKAPDGALELTAEKNLNEEKAWLLSEFPDWKLDIKVEFNYGMILSTVNQYVDEYKADFVVISNKSNYDIDSVLTGQKTHNIVNKINCPVLAVPYTVPFSSGNSFALASDLKALKNINVLDPLKNMLSNSDAELKIFNVSRNENQSKKIENEPIGDQLTTYFKDQRHSFFNYISDDVSSGLIEFSKSENCEILVVVDRKRNVLSKIFEPSKSKKVSQLAEVPILILHD